MPWDCPQCVSRKFRYCRTAHQHKRARRCEFFTTAGGRLTNPPMLALRLLLLGCGATVAVGQQARAGDTAASPRAAEEERVQIGPGGARRRRRARERARRARERVRRARERSRFFTLPSLPAAVADFSERAAAGRALPRL